MPLQVPAIPESQPFAGDGAPPAQQSAGAPASEAGSGAAMPGAMLRSGSTAAAEQRAKNIEVLRRCRSGRLLSPASWAL